MTARAEPPDLNEGPRLRTMQVFTLCVGTIIGVGWITVLGSWLSQAGALGATLAFVTGGLVLIPVGLSYARISTLITDPGGEIAYARVMFGGAAGFMAGWVLFLAFIAVCAFEAISLGWVTAALFPGLPSAELYEVFGSSVGGLDLVIGVLGLVVVTLANLAGPKGTGRFSDLTTYALLAAAVIFVGAGAIFGRPDNLRPLFNTDLPGGAWAGFVAVLVTTPFWFAGFNTAAQAVTAELRSGTARAAGLAVVAAIGASTVFYCGVILAASAVAPRDFILSQDLPAAAAFTYALGSFGKIVLVAGLLGILSTFNAVFFAAVRVLMTLAALWKGQVRGLPQRPSVAAVITCFGLTLLITALGKTVILPIVNVTGICFTLMFALVSLAAWRVRPTETRDDVFDLPGGRYMAALALVLSLSMLAIAVASLWSVDGPAVELLILLAWLALGLPFSLWLKARTAASFDRPLEAHHGSEVLGSAPSDSGSRGGR